MELFFDSSISFRIEKKAFCQNLKGSCTELSNIPRSFYISQAAESCFGHIARGDTRNMGGNVHTLKLRAAMGR